jgi:mycothiol synthase
MSGERAPDGFELRSVSVDDAETIAALINECTLAEIGTPWTTVEETRDALTEPGRDLEHDEALLVARDGTPAGYLQLWATDASPNDLEVVAYVRPSLWGRGLNAWLLRLGEGRARRKPSLAESHERVVLRVPRFADNEPAGRLFASLGYEYERTFWMMRIDLGGPQPSPFLPADISIRTFERGRDDRPLHAMLAEAFADHWGHPFLSFESWSHFDLEGEGSGFDPSLWFLAMGGDEIVGAACCRSSTARDATPAQVSYLAVRGSWRRRGIGLALLLTAFGELHRRGVVRAELGVDAENATGATRLYERAGMHVAYAIEFWQKELSPATSA